LGCAPKGFPFCKRRTTHALSRISHARAAVRPDLVMFFNTQKRKKLINNYFLLLRVVPIRIFFVLRDQVLNGNIPVIAPTQSITECLENLATFCFAGEIRLPLLPPQQLMCCSINTASVLRIFFT
jgi:hypothetical protein